MIYLIFKSDNYCPVYLLFLCVSQSFSDQSVKFLAPQSSRNVSHLDRKRYISPNEQSTASAISVWML